MSSESRFHFSKTSVMLPSPAACSRWVRSSALALAVVLAPPSANAQAGDQPSASKPESPEQLEQLVAPIALYPDSLLSQILMASTYPLEIVEAARWVKAHPKLDSKALEDAMQSQSWDPSVKSLTAFPQVLEMMNDKLTWTTQLGDAFLSSQKGIMNAVQVLRQKAKEEGNLESNEQQKVAVKPEPTGSQEQTIIIEPANPQVVYVPTYNPTVVYGAWAYPAYPPYYWYPPGYVATASVVSFGVGLAVGAALWGNCNWGHSDVNINVNRYNSFNRTQINNVNWKHDGRHRGGVSYGNRDLQQRYGKSQSRDAKARESFRGRADQGRQQIASGQADRFKGRNPQSGRAGELGLQEGGFRRESAGGSGNRDHSAFGGMRNGSGAFRNSDRGFKSRGGSSRWGGGSGRRSGGSGRHSGGGGRHGGFGGLRGGGHRR